MEKISTRVFLNYRREDTSDYAERLAQALTEQFGATNVFRDVASIQPGENFPAAIERAVVSSDVVLALIGKKWLTLSNEGHRRIDADEDYVRLEIETALANEVEIIPVLVDGVEMPKTEELPKSIASLRQLEAYRLSWHQEVAKLGSRVETLGKQHAEKKAAIEALNARIDLVPSDRVSQPARPGNMVIKLMELALERKHLRIKLSERDLNKQALAIIGRAVDEGMSFREMVYLIDHVGIAACGRASIRYCARSIAVRSIKGVLDQLRLNHPVLAGATVFDFWFSESVSKKGIIDLQEVSGFVQGGVFVGIVGHDPSTSMFRLLTPWPTWGEHGYGWITERAAAAYLDRDLRALDAARMIEIPPRVAEERERVARRNGRKRAK